MTPRSIRFTQLVTLVACAVFCLWSLGVSTREWGGPDQRFATSRLIPTIPLTMLVLSYGALLRRGSSVVSLVAFVGSFIGLGAVLSIWGGTYLKGFAPAAPDEAQLATRTGALIVACTVGVVVAAFGVAWRATRRAAHHT